MKVRVEVYFSRGMKDFDLQERSLSFKEVRALVTFFLKIPLGTLNKIKCSQMIKNCGTLSGLKPTTDNSKNLKSDMRLGNKFEDQKGYTLHFLQR